MKLKDKIALVTGSSSGIGRAVAELFAKEGAIVIVTSHSSISEGNEVACQINNNGGKAQYNQADLTDEGDIEKLFNEIGHKYGRLDILVNNAGRTFAAPFKDITKQTLQKDIECNFVSAILCSKEAAKIMPKKGNIINTSSIRGINHTGREGIMGYSAAKAAINNFTLTLAKELAPKILVNAVVPGFVHTGYMDKVSCDLKDEWLRNIPLKRFIKPEEIAEAYLFLATTDIMTGTLLVVDCGFTLKIA